MDRTQADDDMRRVGAWAPLIVLLALLFVLALSGCFMGPEIEHINRREMEPPAEYRGWYEDTATCLGLPSRWDEVRWFVADSLILDGERIAWGVTNFETQEITIWRGTLHYRRTVRHESSHQISGVGVGIHYDGGRRAFCDSPKETKQ